MEGGKLPEEKVGVESLGVVRDGNAASIVSTKEPTAKVVPPLEDMLIFHASLAVSILIFPYVVFILALVADLMSDAQDRVVSEDRLALLVGTNFAKLTSLKVVEYEGVFEGLCSRPCLFRLLNSR